MYIQVNSGKFMQIQVNTGKMSAFGATAVVVTAVRNDLKGTVTQKSLIYFYYRKWHLQC